MPKPTGSGMLVGMDSDATPRRRRRRRTRRRKREGATTPPAGSDEEPTTAPAPKPRPQRRQPEARKPRSGVPHPDRAGISTSMAMRARDVSRTDG